MFLIVCSQERRVQFGYFVNPRIQEFEEMGNAPGGKKDDAGNFKEYCSRNCYFLKYILILRGLFARCVVQLTIL